MLTVCRYGITTLSLGSHDAQSKGHHSHMPRLGNDYGNANRATPPPASGFQLSASSAGIDRRGARDKNRAVASTATPTSRRQRCRSRIGSDYRISTTKPPVSHPLRNRDLRHTISPLSRTRLGSLREAVFVDGFTRALEVFEDLAVCGDGVGEDRIDLGRVE